MFDKNEPSDKSKCYDFKSKATTLWISMHISPDSPTKMYIWNRRHKNQPTSYHKVKLTCRQKRGSLQQEFI